MRTVSHNRHAMLKCKAWEKGYSLTNLAKEVGIAYGRILHFSSGNYLPYEDEAKAICEALGCSVEEVFTEGYNIRLRK